MAPFVAGADAPPSAFDVEVEAEAEAEAELFATSAQPRTGDGWKAGHMFSYLGGDRRRWLSSATAERFVVELTFQRV